MDICKNSRRSPWIGLILVLLLPVLGAGRAEAATKHLAVGAVQPCSGPISIVGLGMGRGFQLYFDKVNEQGGVKIGDDKYLIDFILEDGKSNPEASGTAATKLVHQDGAKFIFGAILENATTAIYDVCAPNGVLHLISWVNITGHPADVSPDKPLCVRPAISPHDAQIPLLDCLRRLYPQAETIVISAPNMGYEPMIELFDSAAKERGLKVVAVEKWEWGIEDFIPVCIKALACKPDVFYAMMSAQAQYQLRSARELGFKGVFVTDSPNDAELHIEVAGKGATDVICAGLDMNYLTDEMREIVGRWEKKYGEKFVSFSTIAWDQAATLVQGMEKAQSVDPEKVLTTLETMSQLGSLQTSYGLAHMGGLEMFGVNRVLVRPIPISHIMDGKTRNMELVLPDVK